VVVQDGRVTTSVAETSRSPSRALRVAAVLAPALVCFGLSAFLALRQPLFIGGDERAHLMYTASIIDGRLPEFDDDFGASERLPIIRESLEGRPGSDRDLGVWVAYHPPVAYVGSAPFVWAADKIGPDSWGPLAMRVVNAAAMATGVALTGLFAGEAFPRRRGIGFAAACVTAVIPYIVAYGGAGQNDGLAFALSAACLYVAARLFRRSPTPWSIAAAWAVASAAMLTRVSLAPMAALVVAAAAVAVWRHRTGRWRAAASLGTGALVGLGVTLASGWFYLRNLDLYGRLMAPEVPSEFTRPSPGSLVEVLTDAHFHEGIWSGLYGSINAPLMYVHALWLLEALGAVLLVGLVLAGARGVARRRLEARAGGGAATADGIGAIGWVLVGCAVVVVLVGTAQFYSQGGAAYPRYLFPVVPVVSALLARAISELPCPRLVLATVVGGLAAVLLTQVARLPELLDTMALVPPFDRSAADPSVSRSALVLAAAAAVVSVIVGWRLGAGPAPRTGDARASPDLDLGPPETESRPAATDRAAITSGAPRTEPTPAR
jgi:4-amino-4-deoxy-L-arabinose transferase-like glycosyltransferase